MKKEITAKPQEPLERKEHYSTLLLLYGPLLSATIRRRMENCYLDDYSLSEIAENESVSRNAVYLSLREGEKELDEYEEALHLSKKAIWLEKRIEEAEKNPQEQEKFLQDLKGEFLHGI
ncbi:MAG: DNA-binding protein [Bacilli bacterium]|jgi:predicted DNA-binding protein YlxM (UPF0122 family)|nr:DNA-binding protein [Bacilli bacterium]MCH3966562.1 DNA-binding protein [Bacilli bacterium]